MNARADPTLLLSLRAADPLANLKAPTAAIADLAFGSLTADASVFGDGHLAILPSEALELDLADPLQRQFGDYELRELIGRGGMGVVYRAHQASLDREVAVKLLAAGPWASREFIERFRFEAQNAARMQHPNIVAIYEVGAAEEMHFFSMRLVHGGSLAALLKHTGRLDPRRAAQLLRTVAEAVDYAHRLGVLHLDLKPANVLLDEAGNPHVADFGLARRLEHDLSTVTTEVSGTPSYMAPEQATAGPQKITPATDIWGLGAILYELVTGEPPFLSDSPQETLKLVVAGTVRGPRRFVPTLPRDLEAITLKCMAHEVSARYANARELADDLGRFLAGYQVRARPLNAAQRTWRWARREPKLAATAVLAFGALAVGILATTQQWRRAEDNAGQRQIALLDQRRDAIEKLFEQDMALIALPQIVTNLADEEAIGAGQRMHADRHRIGAVMANAPQLEANTRLQLVRAESCVALSPDGRRVAVAYSPDGKKGAVRLVDIATQRALWETAVQADANNLSDLMTLREIAFSSDGKRIIGRAAWGSDEIRPSGLSMVALDAADGHSLMPADQAAAMLTVSYDAQGQFALVQNPDRRARMYRTSDWQPLGPAFAPLSGRDGYFGYQVGADASWVAIVEKENTLLRIVDPRNGKELRRHRFDPPLSAWAARPDARQLALAQESGAITLLDFASMTFDELPQPPIGRVWVLRYSADGGWLAAGATDSSAHVWDVASHSLAAMPIPGGRDKLYGVVPDDSSHLLLTLDAGSNFFRVWRLPETSDARANAIELPGQPAHGSRIGRSAIAYAPAARRLASLSSEGDLRIWRLPPEPLLDASAAPQRTDTLYFDGLHAATADGNIVTVKNVTTGAAEGAAITLPQPTGFAALAADGDTLITTNGRMLDAWDWRTGARRMPGVALSNTPLRLAVSADGKFAAASWSELRGGEAMETIELVDLRAGKILAESKTDGKLFGLRFDGDDLFAWTFDHLQVLDRATAAMRYPALSRDARIVGVAVAAGKLHTTFSHDNGGRELCTWTVVAGTLEACQPLLRATQIAADAARVYSSDEARDRAGTLLFGMPTTSTSQYTASPIAVRDDAAMIAIGTASGVLIVDGNDGHPLAPVLAAALGVDDWVTQIAWAPAAEGALLARTLKGRWLHWRLPIASQGLDELRSEAALLGVYNAPNEANTAVLVKIGKTPDAATSTVPSPPAATRPVASSVARRIAGKPILPRSAGTDPRLLDLTAFYTAALGGLAHADNWDADPTDFASLPQGVVRVHGVDFDLRGQIALCKPGLACPNAMPSVARGIPSTRPHPAALDLLVTTSGWVWPGMPYAYVRFRYADGSNERAALLAERDLSQFKGVLWSKAPLAWWVTGLMGDGYASAETIGLYHARVANPAPQKTLASIDFEVSLYFRSAISVFAATLQDGDNAENHPRGETRHDPD